MENGRKKQRKIYRRLFAVLCCILTFVVSVLGVLQMGCWYADNAWRRWSPDYERVDIAPLLEKESLTEEDYELLYRQTGLTALAIDDMRTSSGGRGRILQIQQVFFTDFEVSGDLFAPFTYSDQINGTNMFCDLQEGDIILTATTRVSWWRYGHAAVVVEGGYGWSARLAECFAPGEKSTITYAKSYDSLADFLVLRPKVDEETKRQVVNYIQTDLLNLPYSFTVGILSKKYPKTLKATQCAHFVWYAYKKHGVDLDSNGGGLVKPQDIANSKHVELVQAFGFDLDDVWS